MMLVSMYTADLTSDPTLVATGHLSSSSVLAPAVNLSSACDRSGHYRSAIFPASARTSPTYGSRGKSADDQMAWRPPMPSPSLHTCQDSWGSRENWSNTYIPVQGPT